MIMDKGNVLYIFLITVALYLVTNCEAATEECNTGDDICLLNKYNGFE